MNKYNIGDKVWLIIDHRVAQKKIEGITMAGGKVVYSVEDSYFNYKEEYVFKTRQELIESL